MTRIQSFDIETSNITSPKGKVRNPYGPPVSAGGESSIINVGSSSHSRSYILLTLAVLVFYCMGQAAFHTDGSHEELTHDNKWKASNMDASGGWGIEHNHPVVGNYHVEDSNSNRMSANRIPPQSSVQTSSFPSSKEISEESNNSASSNADHELWESDLLQLLSPLVIIPTHPLHEYKQYQTQHDSNNRDTGTSVSGMEMAINLLYDKSTPHGKAFDFLLNHDTRPHQEDNSMLLLEDEMQYLVQRFVVTLLFYSTGGRDAYNDNTTKSYSIEVGENKKRNEQDEMRLKRRSGGGWESSTAHFLTGLHECHWVRKSMEDQFWSMLSIDKENDRRVGVTKCNANMEVTEICLADLNLVGFIPEEIKWLSSLEYLDLQNNHLTGPIPESLGDLLELKYLSLDGNSFSGTIPDVFHNLLHLERAFLNFNDFNSSMPPSMCNLREEGSLQDLWSDCAGYPITCTCCTVCCDMVAECSEMESQMDG